MIRPQHHALERSAHRLARGGVDDSRCGATLAREPPTRTAGGDEQNGRSGSPHQSAPRWSHLLLTLDTRMSTSPRTVDVPLRFIGCPIGFPRRFQEAAIGGRSCRPPVNRPPFSRLDRAREVPLEQRPQSSRSPLFQSIPACIFWFPPKPCPDR